MNLKRGITSLALALAASAASISPSFADAVSGAVEKQGLNIEAIVMFADVRGADPGHHLHRR